MIQCQRCGKRPALIHRASVRGTGPLGEFCAHCTAMVESGRALGELIPDRDHPRWRGADPMEVLTDETAAILEAGVQYALSWGYDRLKSEFVIMALALSEHPVSRRLGEAGLTQRRLEAALEARLPKGEPATARRVSLTPRMKRVLVQAFREALNQEQRLIAPEHLLTGLLSEHQNLAAIMLAQAGPGPGPETMLDRYARDLTQLARSKQLTHVIGRETEITRVIQALYRGSSIVLIGDPGSGKGAIAEGLAQRIVEGDVPLRLAARRLLEVDLAEVRDAVDGEAEFARHLETLLREAGEQQGLVILVVDDLPSALADREACRILGAALGRGDLQVLGTGTLEGYHRLAHDPELGAHFQPFLISEATPEETLEMLHELRGALEARHRVQISEHAVIAAVELTDHYVHDHPLPDKAIDALDEAAAMIRLEHPLERSRTDLASRQGADDPRVEAEAIARVLSNWTGLPAERLATEEAARMVAMEGMLRKHIIGQEESLRAVAEAVRIAGTGIKDPERPIASLLFAGPDAPGKVETALAIAEFLFDDETALTRCDMTDFTDECDLKRLLGAPRGETDTPAPLAQAMRRHPHAVLLFENIERAHAECFTALLEVLDDGCLIDARGRKVDLHHAVVLMTTGVAAAEATSGLEAISKETMTLLRQQFRPEFLNRFDEIVIFHPLTPEELAQLLDPMLAHTRRQLHSQGLDLELSGGARARLAQEGTAPALRRAVKRLIEAPVSRLLLAEEGDLHGQVLYVEARDDGQLELKVAPPRVATRN